MRNHFIYYTNEIATLAAAVMTDTIEGKGNTSLEDTI